MSAQRGLALPALPGGPSRFTLTPWALGLALAGLMLAALTLGAHAVGGSASLLLPPVTLAAVFLIANPRLEVSLAITGVYLGALDGYLKLSSGSGLATAGRDVIILAIAAGALVRFAVRGGQIKAPPYLGHVLLFVGIVAAECLNPGTPGIKGALGGFKQELEFVPLFFLGYAALTSERRLRGFVVVLILVGAASALAALVQLTLSPQEFASWGPGYSQRILGSGGFAHAGRTFSDVAGNARVRPFGLGSDEGAAGILGVISLSGAFAVIMVGRSARLKAVGVVGAAGAVLGILTSQSRLVIIAGAMALLLFGALSASSRQAARAFGALLVGGLVIYLVTSALSGVGGGTAFSRFGSLGPGQLGSTALAARGSSLSVTPTYAGRYPFGAGLGRVGPAAGFGGGASSLNVENEFNLLISEVGAVGLLVLAGLWLRVAYTLVRFMRAAAPGPMRTYLAALSASLLALIVTWFGSSPTTQPPSSPFFWVLAGLAAGLIAAERRLGSAWGAITSYAARGAVPAEELRP